MSIKNIENMPTIGIQWLFSQAAPEYWNLDCSDLSNLLGVDENSIRIFEHELKLKVPLNLTKNTRNRLSKLLTIHKTIYEISPKGQENSFFINPNYGSFLAGRSIKEFLIKEATIKAMDKVIIWLKSSI